MSNCVIRLMLGNHAIAQGAMESGLAVAAGYPGTPSSEIMEYILDYGKELGIYAEWSSNEKVAFEVAYGAALAGARAIVTMKHVGLNVAMDPLMSSAYTGVKGGFVIVTADDPGMWSSQNEQDNRWVGLHAYIPVFEPYDPQSAKDITKIAFEFSEDLGHPVLLRTVTRVSHVRGPVLICPPSTPRYADSFIKNPSREALIPANARALKAELIKRWGEIGRRVDELPHAYVDGGKALIITSGVAYTYVMEAVKEHNINASILNIITPVPIPRKTVLDAVTRADEVIVVEEGDPVVEEQVKALLFDNRINVRVLGKSENIFPRVGELTPDNVLSGLSKALGLSISTGRGSIRVNYTPPPRPPVFCPGCPHTASFYELKISVARAGVKPVFSGDIGCYSLGINNPFNEQDTLTNMGSSLGLGMGINRGTGGRSIVVSIIGDSTFFHAGLPALVNAIFNKTPMLVLVLDNRVTAMTGGQPNPTNVISIESLVRGMGVKYVWTVDPFDVKQAQEVLRRAIEVVKNGELAVVVMKRGCALEAVRLGRGMKIPHYYVDEGACRACGICYNLIACPAIVPLENRKAWIDPNMCVGCSVCAQACPYGAIKPSDDVRAWLSKWAEM
ncbi:indolepyruvate ferredoxin oxidoreductase subunit alpha [Vulcanisaeta thermophila]|uniref:indolepyruvate ferredoxin oxidoreductase subunit alpha n=1 Tax=Vulcanisaeta thermophila TaxID=867917 RepID=UPI00085378E3|nr:indolepyruvate ferredoxin oxidoreductase subunit alpha [Vulcanisaeta thermophila]